MPIMCAYLKGDQAAASIGNGIMATSEGMESVRGAESQAGHNSHSTSGRLDVDSDAS